MKLQHGRKYLQVALNSNLGDAQQIISQLPQDSRILLEAGTPLIKSAGIASVSRLMSFWRQQGLGAVMQQAGLVDTIDAEFAAIVSTKAGDTSSAGPPIDIFGLLNKIDTNKLPPPWRFVFKQFVKLQPGPAATAVAAQVNVPAALPKAVSAGVYVVADLKTADLASWEVRMAAEAGASGATCLGVAPTETIDFFIEECKKYGIDSMLDMMAVKEPVLILQQLRTPPDVVILHRGVDEESLNKEKELPYYDIGLIKNSFDVLIAIAGGDDFHEVQRAILNDVDIVVVWKSFFSPSLQTAILAEQFLKEIH